MNRKLIPIGHYHYYQSCKTVADLRTHLADLSSDSFPTNTLSLDSPRRHTNPLRRPFSLNLLKSHTPKRPNQRTAESKNSAMDSMLLLLQEDNKNILVAVAQGVVPVLVRLLDSSSSPEIKEKTVAAIFRVSTVDSSRTVLIAEGLLLLNNLLHLAESGGEFSEEKACIAIQLLSQSKDNERELEVGQTKASGSLSGTSLLVFASADEEEGGGGGGLLKESGRER